MERIYSYPIWTKCGQNALILLFIVVLLSFVYATQHFILNIVQGSDTYHWFPKILLGFVFTLKIISISYHIFWTDKVYIQKKFSLIDDLPTVRDCFPNLVIEDELWLNLSIQQRELILSDVTKVSRFYSDVIEDLFILQMMLFLFGWFFIIDSNRNRYIAFYCIFSSFEFILSTIPTIWLTLFYFIKRKLCLNS